MPLPGQFAVGMLYNGGYVGNQLVFTQPGGIGTPVVPQPPTLFPEQYMGYQQFPVSFSPQYFFGCGHPINQPTIYQYCDPYAAEIMALIVCPCCTYIQEIMPLSQYQDNEQVPIVVA